MTGLRDRNRTKKMFMEDDKIEILRQIGNGEEQYRNGVSIYRNCGTVQDYIRLRDTLQDGTEIPPDFEHFIDILRHLDRLLADGKIRGIPRRDEKGNLTDLMNIVITEDGEELLRQHGL